MLYGREFAWPTLRQLLFPVSVIVGKDLWSTSLIWFNSCLWWQLSLVLEKTLESSLDSKEIKLVNPKGNQSWIFIGRSDADAEVEAPILWPPKVKNWLFRKDPDAGKDWRQEQKWATEDEMVGWHHRLYGHEFEQAPGVGDGQGILVCYSPWGFKELDTTKWLNWWWQWFKFVTRKWRHSRLFDWAFPHKIFLVKQIYNKAQGS